MREDFFFRIHVFPVRMPPLRERKEDIPLLIDRLCEDSDSPDVTDMTSFSNEALTRIMAYDWPGNVRELQNAIQRYITTRNIDFLSSNAPAPNPKSFGDPAESTDTILPLKEKMQEVEKRIYSAGAGRKSVAQVEGGSTVGNRPKKPCFAKSAAFTSADMSF